MIPSVSLIITTYNWVAALEFVLQSVTSQSHLPNEVIIADDGSTVETQQLIEQFQADFPVPLIHAWQTDEGFRAARSRNNAVTHASSEYLIFIDGDMVLHRDFVADHLAFATTNRFTVGSRVLISDVATQGFFARQLFDFSWWRTSADNKLNGLHIMPLARYYAKAVREPLERWMFNVRSCNMGVWRADYEAINGFNHDFHGWGREDSEFALRLFKKGLSMRRLKCVAIQYHLYHQENDRSHLNKNDAILMANLTAGHYRCENGLAQLRNIDSTLRKNHVSST